MMIVMRAFVVIARIVIEVRVSVVFSLFLYILFFCLNEDGEFSI